VLASILAFLLAGCCLSGAAPAAEPSGPAPAAPPAADPPPAPPPGAPAPAPAALLGPGEPAALVEALPRLDVGPEMSAVRIEDRAIVWGSRPDHRPIVEERMDPIALPEAQVLQIVARAEGAVALLRADGHVVAMAEGERRQVPVRPMRALSTGAGACGITRSDEVQCWDGFGDDEGSLAPRLVPRLRGVRRIAAGEWVGLAIVSDGTLRSFGFGSDSALGVGTEDDTSEERGGRVESPGLDEVVDVAALAYTFCALRSDGTVWCWGVALDGRHDDPRPRRLEGIDGAVSLHEGPAALCVRRRDASVACIGELPDGLPRSGVPGNQHTRWVDVPVLRGAREIALSPGHVCWLDASDAVACVGWNELGELGVLPRRTLVPAVPGVGDARWVSGARARMCAGSASTVWCWGGASTWLEAEEPRAIPLPDPATIRAVDLGAQDGCVLRADGRQDCYEGLPDAPRLRSTRPGVQAMAGPCVLLREGGRIVCGAGDAEIELEGAPFRSLVLDSSYVPRHGAVSADGHGLVAFTYSEDPYAAERLTGVERSTSDVEVDAYHPGPGGPCMLAGDRAFCAGRRGTRELGTGVSALAMGSLTCWVDGGRASCIGFMDAAQTLVWSGREHPDAVSGPLSVAGVTDATSIAVGPGRACALRASGEVACITDTRNGGAGVRPAWIALEPVRPVLP